MDDPNLLFNALIYLAFAVVAVPLAKRCGLGSVLGYLIAGIAIGPWGLGLIQNVEDILYFSKFGVVLLLFLIGLELNPKRLWALRRSILGTGGLQVAATTLLLLLIGLPFGLPWHAGLIIAMGLSLSSTAIALQSLKEKNLLPSHAGGTAFSILLFQDIAVIPMLALIPVLGETLEQSGAPLWGGIKALAVIGAIVVGGHYLTRPLFRFIAATGLREIFTAFSLLLVLGIALLMEAVGMSMALGVFLAGVLLAESEYRYELEVAIEPFKGLLLGLFFISVGMSIDFGLLLAQPWLLLGMVAGLMAAKTAVLMVLARRCAVPRGQRALFTFLLCQGGEFAFVLFAVAKEARVLAPEWTDLLFVVVALSMAVTPLLLLLNDRYIEPRFRHPGEEREADTIMEADNPVIIAGFGQYGRVVGRLLHANRIPTTVLDHNPDQIEDARRFGYRVYYGDASRIDRLRAAGADRARLLIVAVDSKDDGLAIVDMAQRHFPHLTILSRARNRVHAMELLKRNVALFEYEMFESALRLGEASLKCLGHGAYQAKQMAHIFRDHERSLLQKIYETDAAEKHIYLSQQAREELARVLEADEEERRQRWDQGWRES